MNEQILREGSEHLWQDQFPRIEANTSDPTAGMTRERKLATYEEALWWLGWSDGGTGQASEPGIELINTHTRARRRLRSIALHAQFETASARDKAASEMADALAERLEHEKRELHALEERRRQNPHEMSLFTGIAYVIVALILLVADMPLSLNLVADAFHMPHTYELAPGDVLTFSDLFVAERRFLVLRYLWEPLVLAIGIAALGIFFKLVSDYLLSTAPMLQNWPRTLKVLKGTFFGGACVLMVVGLIAVGLLRAQQQAITQAAEQAAAVDEFSVTAAATDAPLTETSVTDTTTSSTEAAPASDNEEENAATTATAAFIIMAIALPLIGGICFSVGWKRVQQSGRVLYLRWTAAWLLRRVHRNRLKAALARAEAAAVQSEIDDLDDPSETSMPLQVYLHGYARGFTAPQRLEPHRTLYGRCREVMHHWVASGLQDDNLKRTSEGR